MPYKDIRLSNEQFEIRHKRRNLKCRRFVRLQCRCIAAGIHQQNLATTRTQGFDEWREFFIRRVEHTNDSWFLDLLETKNGWAEACR